MRMRNEDKLMKQEPVVIGVDIKSKSLSADLLDCISGFPRFADEFRKNGANEEFTTMLINDLIHLFRS